ncbi:MAG: hypothetical protein AAGE98_01255 [Actinomycetota bacterium]
MSRRQLLVGAAYLGALIALNATDATAVVSAGVLGFTLLLGVFSAPAFTAGVLLVLAALAGGWTILAAAPVVVLLAARAAQIDGRSVGGRFGLRTIGMLVAAFLLTVPFAALAIGSSFGSSGAEPAPAVFADDGDGDASVLAQIVDAVRDAFGQGSNEAPGTGSSPPDPESSFNWWFVVAIVLLVLAVVLAAVWWWTRRRRLAEASGWSLARLERVGAAVGRRRRPHEGPLTYASALASHTGDERLRAAGPLVSSRVYDAISADDRRTDESLRGLEASPPAKPHRTLRERISARGFDRRTAMGVASVGVAGLALWLLATRGGDLRDDPFAAPADAASIGTPVDDPEAWDFVLQAPSASLERWVACAGYGDGGFVLSVGLRHEAGTTITLVESTTLEYGTRSQTIWGPDETLQSVVATDLSKPYPPPQWFPSGPKDAPTAGFDSVDAVVETFGADPTSRVELVAGDGTTFTRFETVPDEFDQYHPDRPWQILGFVSFDTVWALDVWTDAVGRPVRVRTLGHGEPPRWFEWSLTPVGDTNRLSGECTIDSSVITSWEPTIEAPLLIASDAAGNLFDVGWHGTESLPVASVDVVDLGPSLLVGPAFLLDEPVEDVARIVASIPAGPTEVRRLGQDGWISAFVVERLDEPVVSWVRRGTVEGWEGSILIAVGRVPDLGAAGVDAAYGYEDATRQVDDDAVVVDGNFDLMEVVLGVTASGDVGTVVFAEPDLPWRLLGLDHVAPSWVLEREAELRACIAGDRAIEPTGACSAG